MYFVAEVDTYVAMDEELVVAVKLPPNCLRVPYDKPRTLATILASLMFIEANNQELEDDNDWD